MTSPAPVIIDTDPGVDDALALLLAGVSPELDVVAVTTVAGNVGLERATENARRVVAVAWEGRPLPPVYRGACGGSETAESVHGTDGLGGAAALRDSEDRELYPASAPLSDGDAAGAILSLAARFPGEVTLIALGPLTNVAEALRREPAAVRLLKRVVIMGGAFREAGNVTPLAEFNIFVDPAAAQAVCDSGVPLTWVPLDVTHRCLLRQDVLSGLVDNARVRLARHVTGQYMRHHEGGYGEFSCFLHDPLAVGAVLWPELLPSLPMRVDVETAGRLTVGMTVVDFRPAAFREPAAPNAEVCLEVDAEQFVSRFLERLAA